ncbi:hypothetical protein FOYG_17480 [Fusarium oxysporum NRRL 32931]|uniref:Uncharacterized protein n=1 Tax=Fusarium oxysporum NRRL 32931 TaxID=660029 RepID=W9HEA6_FUSOX|nr:hypothetical protein FOYG_17480 [Fusarium oxysporum NRRL 32931]
MQSLLVSHTMQLSKRSAPKRHAYLKECPKTGTQVRPLPTNEGEHRQNPWEGNDVRLRKMTLVPNSAILLSLVQL